MAKKEGKASANVPAHERLHYSRLHHFGLQEKKWQREYSTDRLTGQPLFKPMINPVSNMIMEGGRKDRYATGVTDVGEALYRNAFNRQLRHIIAAHKADEREKSKRNEHKPRKATNKQLARVVARDVAEACDDMVHVLHLS